MSNKNAATRSGIGAGIGIDMPAEEGSTGGGAVGMGKSQRSSGRWAAGNHWPSSLSQTLVDGATRPSTIHSRSSSRLDGPYSRPSPPMIL